MYNDKMVEFGQTRSVIRELAEYGKQLAEQIGRDKVYDFTLGNPSAPTPTQVNANAADKILHDKTIHSYTSQQGLPSVRNVVAEYNRKQYNMPVSANHVYMTCGANAGLAISLCATITDEQDEVIVFVPYYPEYRIFAESAGGKIVAVPMDEEHYQIDFSALKKALSRRTAAVVVNSPNNPSGIVYTEQTLKQLAKIMKEAEAEFGNVIVLISDEPYREIVFDVPFASPVNYYDDSVLCYSYSKSLSLPGERIGYLALNDNLTECDRMYDAVMGAGRALGYVCAPSLWQQVIAECISNHSDTTVYRENRDILYKALTEIGFTAVNPQGAFYLLMKVPNGNAEAFVDSAKSYGLLMVPTDSFGLTGYVRIATCVSQEMLVRALPVFAKFAADYFKMHK